jgi:preprotein translocase SecE subunit
MVPCAARSAHPFRAYRAVAQLVEHRIPNPAVAGSIPACPARVWLRAREEQALMEVSRFVFLFYATVFGCAAATFNKAVEAMWQALEITDASIVGKAITLTDLIAFALSVGVTIWAYQREDYRTYVTETIIELQKVTWPKFKETKRSTLVVFAFTVIVSFFLFIFDKVWGFATDLLLTPGV